MRFDNTAIGAVAMVPFVDIQHHRRGEVVLIPPGSGTGQAVVDCENFTGRFTIATTVTFESTGNTKTLLTRSIEEEANDDGVEIVEASNNRSVASSNSRNPSASPSDGGMPDYTGILLPELREIYKARFGKYPAVGVNKAEVRKALMADDVEIPARSNGTNCGGANPTNTDLFEVSDDDDDDDDLLIALDQNEDGAQDRTTEDEPANPEGNDFVDESSTGDDETSNQEGNASPNGDSGNLGNEDEPVNLEGMKVAELKQYFKDQEFEGSIPSKTNKAGIIALIKKKQAAQQESVLGNSTSGGTTAVTNDNTTHPSTRKSNRKR